YPKGDPMFRRTFSAALAAAILLGALTAARADDPQSSSASKKETKTNSKPGIVAVFRFAHGVSESPADDTFSFSGQGPVPLKDLVARLRKAAKDPSVKAVALLADGGGAGHAQTEELRQAMGFIRSAGKDVFVHADSLSMGEYALYSGASRVSLVPTADL